MEIHPQYIIVILLLVLLIPYVYIRLSYGFWYHQPVFHIYDLHYYLFPCGIIDKELPQKNRYTNLDKVQTTFFDKINKSYKFSRFVNFIRTHYLRNGNNEYLPTKKNISPYFYGHKHPSFITFYNEPHLIQDNKTTDIISDKKTIGVMTARPLHVTIYNGSNDAVFYAYYVDFLCIDKEYRKKGVAPEIIQTHYFNQRRMNKKVFVDLFKREGDLTGIVPLCVYSTYGFNIQNWIRPHILAPEYNLIEITSKNIVYLLDFMKMNVCTLFDISITPELSNVLQLIKTNNYIIYILLDTSLPEEHKVLSAYFFKNTSLSITKNSKCISSIASIKDKETSNYFFIEGFKLSLFTMKTKFPFLLMEEISHNSVIIDNLKLDNIPFFVSPTAYFFYNFAYNTFNSKKVLIIGD
jgi:hypothetical protein